MTLPETLVELIDQRREDLASAHDAVIATG